MKPFKSFFQHRRMYSILFFLLLNITLLPICTVFQSNAATCEVGNTAVGKWVKMGECGDCRGYNPMPPVTVKVGAGASCSFVYGGTRNLKVTGYEGNYRVQQHYQTVTGQANLSDHDYNEQAAKNAAKSSGISRCNWNVHGKYVDYGNDDGNAVSYGAYPKDGWDPGRHCGTYGCLERYCSWGWYEDPPGSGEWYYNDGAKVHFRTYCPTLGMYPGGYGWLAWGRVTWWVWVCSDCESPVNLYQQFINQCGAENILSWDNETCTGGCDLCPDDPDKIEPGICGCNVPDIDTDGDGTLDCNDECPEDPDVIALPCIDKDKNQGPCNE